MRQPRQHTESQDAAQTGTQTATETTTAREEAETMTMEQIRAWVEERNQQRQERRYSSHGDTDETRVSYEDGSTYHQETRYRDMWNLHIDIEINGEQVHSADYTWHNFGWKRATA